MSDFEKQESEFSKQLQRSSFDDLPRQQHRDELRQRVLEEFDRATIRKSKPLLWISINSWRQLMSRPIPRFIAVTVLCLSVAAPWIFSQGHESKAYGFGNFANVLVDAKSAKFQIEVKVEGLPGQKAQAFYLAPGKFRSEISMPGREPMIAIADEIAGQTLSLMPGNKTAIMSINQGRSKDQTQLNPFEQIRKLLAEDKDSKEKMFKPVGNKEINGKKATGFGSESTAVQTILWGDPATGYPVRVEMVSNGTPRSETVLSDFEINGALDPSLFELKAPADFKVTTMQLDLSKPSETDLIDAFKLCAKISGGKFPDSMGLIRTMRFTTTHLKERLKNVSTEDSVKIWQEVAPINRGFRFAYELPPSADSAYAGKGVTKDDASKPIFWYKPMDSTNYRIVYADFSIKESDAAPQVADAERLNSSTSPKKAE